MTKPNISVCSLTSEKSLVGRDPARVLGRSVWHARGRLKDGGREGIRTPGLLVANEALSQLSYSPTVSARNHCSINTLWENLGTIKRPAFQPQPCAVPE